MNVQKFFTRSNQFLDSMVRFYLKYAFVLLGLLLISAFFAFIWGWGLADNGSIDGSYGWTSDLIIYRLLIFIIQLILLFQWFSGLVIVIKSYFQDDNAYIDFVYYHGLSSVFLIVGVYRIDVMFLIFYLIALIFLVLHKLQVKNNNG